MKAYFARMALRIDALNLRERITVFGAASAFLVYLLHALLLGHTLSRQKLLTQQIERGQNNIAGIETEISAKLAAYGVDPDAPLRERLADINGKIAAKGEDLRTMQKGLVAPSRIAPLLQSILRSSGNLRLVSLQTLPVTGLDEPMPLSAAQGQAARTVSGQGDVRDMLTSTMARANGQVTQAPAPILPFNLPGVAGAAAAPGAAQAPAAAAAPVAAKPAPKAGELIYRHGVEIVVEGSYLDMIAYMNALEGMPTQLFWGKASLDAKEYQKARLTLVLFTLSLDQRWMKL